MSLSNQNAKRQTTDKLLASPFLIRNLSPSTLEQIRIIPQPQQLLKRLNSIRQHGDGAFDGISTLSVCRRSGSSGGDGVPMAPGKGGRACECGGAARRRAATRRREMVPEDLDGAPVVRDGFADVFDVGRGWSGF